MFTKINKTDGEVDDLTEPKIQVAPSLLSADLNISGDLTSTGELQIDGTVTGEVRADTLILGTTASVIGDIAANTVRIYGKLVGQVNAKSVSLGKTADVTGDILHEYIAIENGAALEGHCRRSQVEEDLSGNRETEIPNPITMLVKGSSKSYE